MAEWRRSRSVNKNQKIVISTLGVEAEKEGEKGSKGDVACYWGEQPPEASEVSMSRGPRPVDNTYRQVSERRDSALVGLRART